MNEIATYDPTRAQVDEFFAARPVETDWIEKLQLARDGKLNVESLLMAIKAREPLAPGSLHEHEVWVNQQLLRLALRQAEGKHLLDYTCGECGSRMRDPVLESCLWCAEANRQNHHGGGRGSCYYVHPVYDPPTSTWGLLFYNYHHESKFLLWLAKGFASLHEAKMALYPVGAYDRWLDRKYNGVYNTCRLTETLFPLDSIMKMRGTLPLTPDLFTAHLKNAILEHIQTEHDLIAWATERGLDDYHHKENS